MSEYVIHMQVKKLQPPREDSRYDDYKTLAQFDLPADTEAFFVFHTAFAQLAMPRATVTLNINDETEETP